jgi:hypothetical protein
MHVAQPCFRCWAVCRVAQLLHLQSAFTSRTRSKLVYSAGTHLVEHLPGKMRADERLILLTLNDRYVSFTALVAKPRLPDDPHVQR